MPPDMARSFGGGAVTTTLAPVVLVAMAIGFIQLLSLIANFSSGPFWDGVGAVGDHFDVIGGGICGAFVVFGAASVVFYRPWRRRMDRKYRAGVVEAVELEEGKKEDQKTPAGSSSRESE